MPLNHVVNLRLLERWPQALIKSTFVLFISPAQITNNQITHYLFLSLACLGKMQSWKEEQTAKN